MLTRDFGFRDVWTVVHGADSAGSRAAYTFNSWDMTKRLCCAVLLGLMFFEQD